jgi:hypothetical protein
VNTQELIAITQAEMPAIVPGFSSNDPVFLADMRMLWSILSSKWTATGDLSGMTNSVRSAMRVHPTQHSNIIAMVNWFSYINDTNGLGELNADWSERESSYPVHIADLVPEALSDLVRQFESVRSKF